MSSSSVYRYFRSKEELIDAAGQESLARTYSRLTELIGAGALAGPYETLAALIEGLRQRQQGEYDLTKISMAAWTEALRRPTMHQFAHHFYDEMTSLLTALAQQWISDEVLPENADPAALAGLLVTLMPGLLVMTHLYELPTVESLVMGIVEFASTTASRDG